jgi:hypothetical protein
MAKNLINLTEGAEMTKLYQGKNETILDPKYRNIGTLPVCESFDREAFDMLLSLDNCKGIRIYCGMDSDLKVKMVICGVDENDRDLYLTVPNSEDQMVIDSGIRCPTFCPPASVLNS